jgi:hypothetical protein
MKKSTIFAFIVCISLILFSVNSFAGPKKSKQQNVKKSTVLVEKTIIKMNIYELYKCFLNYFWGVDNIPETSSLPPAISNDAPKDPPDDNVPPVSTLPPPTGG